MTTTKGWHQMTTLYVANCSMQNHNFTYRLPEELTTRSQLIRSGNQTIIIGPNADPAALMSIVKHHERFGMVEAKTIDQTRAFTGLCYQWDKPIPVEKFMYVDERNKAAKTEESQETRKVSAAALHRMMQNATEGNSQVRGVELEVIEMADPRSGRSSEFEQKIVVSDGEMTSESPNTTKSRGRPRKVA
jgi:hypothetical protein